MEDRIPTPGQEGRVLITPEDGSAPYYATIEMADNPTNPGTPLNKGTLLKDATAALFQLGVDAVPDDVLSILSKAAILVDGDLKLPDGSLIQQVKIETGEYTGNGLYGSSNPNSLSFDTIPNIVFVFGTSSAEAGVFFPEALTSSYSIKLFYLFASASIYYTYYQKYDQDKLYWYVQTDQTFHSQLNNNNEKYRYIAIFS